jgi:hypothetical protein
MRKQKQWISQIPMPVLQRIKTSYMRRVMDELARKEDKRQMTVYRTTEDIVIPAGTFVNLEPPANRFYVSQYASVPIEIKVAPEGAEWVFPDLEQAVEAGLIEEVPEEPSAA